jgi:hypothetical protein
VFLILDCLGPEAMVRLLAYVGIYQDTPFQRATHYRARPSTNNANTNVKLQRGAGTGFRGIVALLIWISEFGHTCYGSA